jgi:LysM repeat protein
MISKQARRFLIGTALALVATGLVWTRPAAAQGITGTRLVIVAWGDSLRGIAQRYDTTVEAIVTANHLTSLDHISAGQQLVIPVQSTQVAPPLDPDRTHVVQPGETLFRISVNYGVSIDALVAANGLVNPSRIYAGQRLVIPGSSAGSATPSLPLQHVVQRGDTLAEIARRYGVSIWALVQANNISNPSILYVGQVLNITNSSGTSSGEPSSAPAPAPACILFSAATRWRPSRGSTG